MFFHFFRFIRIQKESIVRRIMKRMEFSNSSPVLCPPPLFKAALRKELSTRYWISRELKPSKVNHVLAALFHPDYNYSQSGGTKGRNVVMFNDQIVEDPKYVLERIGAAVDKLVEFGIEEMTTLEFLQILNAANDFALKKFEKFTGAYVTYFRETMYGWQFVTGPENMFKSKYGVVSNNEWTSKRLRWRIFNADDFAAICKVVTLPENIHHKRKVYVHLRKDGAYSVSEIFQSIEWNLLLRYI